MSIIRSTSRRALVLSSLLVLAMIGLLSTGSLATAGASPSANGDPIIMGFNNDETLPTVVTNTQGNYAFAGVSTAFPGSTGLAGTGSATGVIGNGTVTGVAGNGTGGESNGVTGTSNSNYSWGVVGTANGIGGTGVLGQAGGKDGKGVLATGDIALRAEGGTFGIDASALTGIGMLVSGRDDAIYASGTQYGPAIHADGSGGGLEAWGLLDSRAIDARAFGDADGVFGQTSSASASGAHGLNTGNGSGVFGESQGDGNGVFGQTSSGIASGVYGDNKGMGYGVAGRANDGVGVLADSLNGIALQVNGKLQLSRAGLAIVGANRTFVQVTGLSDLDPASSFVIATAQGNSKVWVRSVRVDSTTAFTIYLNARAQVAVPVAWFILN